MKRVLAIAAYITLCAFWLFFSYVMLLEMYRGFALEDEAHAKWENKWQMMQKNQ